jgi:transposase InsO family protein
VTDHRQDFRRAVALFRYSLISDLIHPTESLRGTIQRTLEAKAERDYSIPKSRRTRVAAETIRSWLKLYRRGGFDALLPKERADIGASRAIPKEVQDLILSTKEEHPAYSIPVLIAELRKTGAVPSSLALPASTVHRLLSRAGLMKKPDGGAAHKDHRRFEFEKAGQLWLSDVMHAVAVPLDGKRKHKTYLIAFIDDATRVVPFASFGFAENATTFFPALKQAILRRGIPKRLFVDNGSVFRTQQLEIVLAKLGITLIHARAYHPQAKGKIERFFRTVRGKLMTRLGPDDLRSLDALNRRLWAWVEGEYHQTPHAGLQEETPLDRWAQAGDEVRYAQDLDLDALFLFEQKRKVRKDRTVSLEGVVYEVAADLVDKTVILRFEPNPRARKSVEVWLDGRRIEVAKPVDLRANCFVRRDRPESLALQKLAQDEESF